MQEETENKTNHYQSSTMLQDGRVIKYRLDTNPTILKMERTLRGRVSQSYIDPENGKLFHEETKYGEPLLNDEGFQTIISFYANVINPQSMQAYFAKREDYDRYISKYQEELAVMLMSNRRSWGIRSLSDVIGIRMMVMQSVRVILTSAIGGKMMDSISQTTKTLEQTQPQRTGFLSMFRGR